MHLRPLCRSIERLPNLPVTHWPSWKRSKFFVKSHKLLYIQAIDGGQLDSKRESVLATADKGEKVSLLLFNRSRLGGQFAACDGSRFIFGQRKSVCLLNVSLRSDRTHKLAQLTTRQYIAVPARCPLGARSVPARIASGA